MSETEEADGIEEDHQTEESEEELNHGAHGRPGGGQLLLQAGSPSTKKKNSPSALRLGHKGANHHEKQKEKERNSRKGGKEKTDERKEARQDEREAMVSHRHDQPAGNGTKTDDKHTRETKEEVSEISEPHPLSPGAGRHGDEGEASPKKKERKKRDKEREKHSPPEKPDAGAAQEVIPASPQSDARLSATRRRKEERRREERQHDCGEHELRRASAELPRGHKEKGRAFWHRERTPRHGILTRSLSEEALRVHAKTSHDEVECKKKRKKKQSKRRALQDEGVKFDKVVVRHYPREVSIGGCMLDPDQGPFLGIGWDWTQEEVHNLYAFERLRDPARTHLAHAIPSADRYAILQHYGLDEDEIEELMAEMKRKDKELRKGSSSSILPSFWPWKKVG